MNKYFKEVITAKALSVKLSHQEECEETQQAAAPKAFFRNVCTPIPLPMNEELEKVTGLLGIPKGRFLFLAISSALEEAQELLKNIDVAEYHREFNLAVAAQSEEEAA